MTPAPTVLILAAGQGTRMRSATPKVLHELCGLPMVLWPVRAALAAGAGRVVVVDSPVRAIEPVLPQGVELAVQPEPNGTGGAVVAAIEQLDGSGEPLEGTAIVLSGDVPLIDAEAVRELAEAHERSGAPATMVTSVLADPSGYGRVVRDPAGAVLRVVETKQDGDASAEELARTPAAVPPAALAAGGANAPSTSNSATTRGTPGCLRALMAPLGKCKNRCRRIRPACN